MRDHREKLEKGELMGMTTMCHFAEGGGCSAPSKIAADLKYRVPSLGLKGSIPLCFSHAIQPYILTRAIRGFIGGSRSATVKVIAREPYKSLLKALGIE